MAQHFHFILKDSHEMLKVIKAAPYIQIIKINKVAFKRKIIIKKKKKKRMYKLLPKFIVPYSFFNVQVEVH